MSGILLTQGGTGGDYTQNGAHVANDCGEYNTKTGAKNVGFRVALFSNVDDGNIGGEGVAPITTLSLDKTEEQITVGNPLVLTATINSYAEENVIWTSSNTDVATVQGSGANLRIGTVTPLSAGTTIITARNESGTLSQSCTVTVEEILVAGEPYMPDGFTKVSDVTAISGYTIQDEAGNQYVWIEVPRNDTVYDEVGTELDLDSLSGTDLTTALDNIEEELQEYTVDYRDPNDEFADTYSSLDATGIADEDTYNNLKYTMLKSVYKNQGFYIGKYETGTATERNDGEDALTDAVIQANAYPYNYVTNRQAQEIASGMESGDRTSSLMFGIQWDLVMKYLETKGTDQNVLLSDSSDWGNYSGTLSLTGADNAFSKMGIYDLAGNVAEWTLEQQSAAFAWGSPCTLRGGDYYSDSVPANSRECNPTSEAFEYAGFRVSLY